MDATNQKHTVVIHKYNPKHSAGALPWSNLLLKYASAE